MNELVCNEALVIPNNTLSKETIFFLSAESFSLITFISLRSIISPRRRSESPGSLTSTFKLSGGVKQKISIAILQVI